MNVLIPDGKGAESFYRSVLAMTRALGAQHTVYLGVPDDRLLRWKRLLKPRHCRSLIPLRHPDDDLPGFIEDVNAAADRYGIQVLLPYTDQLAAACAFHTDALRVALPLPDYGTFVRALDKQAAIELAAQNDIPIPLTLCSEDRGAITAWMRTNALRYPIVLKPRQRGGHAGTRLVHSDAELESTLTAWRALGDEVPLHEHRRPLAQERIPGEIHDCCVLYRDGSLRAMLTQVRNRLVGPDGGAAVVCTTTDVREIADQTRRLMDALRWHGPAQVEWIRDRRDGRYRLMEINPRFWGSLGLSIEAGINFPELALQLAVGGAVDERFAYELGLTHRWAFPDELMSILLDRGRPWECLRKYFSPRDLFDRRVHFTLDPRDPRPDLLRALLGTATVVRFALRGITLKRDERGRPGL